MPRQKPRTPLYQRVADDLLGAVREGSPHDLLPSEPELTRHYGVSRGTVKQALDLLEQHGLIYRRQGKGTFIAEPRILRAGPHVPSFSEDIRTRGHVPRIRVVEVDRSTLGDRQAAALGLAAGVGCWKVRRLFLADDEPLALVTSYIRADLVPELNGLDVEQSLYASLERRYGARPSWARDTYTAVKARGRTARLLQVDDGDPLLYSERTAYLADLTPIEYVESLIRGDRFTVSVSWMPEALPDETTVSRSSAVP